MWRTQCAVLDFGTLGELADEKRRRKRNKPPPKRCVDQAIDVKKTDDEEVLNKFVDAFASSSQAGRRRVDVGLPNEQETSQQEVPAVFANQVQPCRCRAFGFGADVEISDLVLHASRISSSGSEGFYSASSNENEIALGHDDFRKVSKPWEVTCTRTDLIDGNLSGVREALGFEPIPKKAPSILNGRDEPAEVRPDFSGHYILSKVEGDPEKGLKNTGFGWAQRKAAIAVGFGVQNVNVEVTQAADQFSITSTTPLGSSTVTFKVGGGTQENKASDGGEFQIDPVWEGKMIKATMQRGGHETRLTRFISGDKMIIESMTSGTYPNNMVREIYTRNI